jgi:hypothetical protein
LYVFCSSPEQRNIQAFFIAKHTVTGVVCLDMLEEFLMPVLEEEGPNGMLFQQGRAPPRFDKEMMHFLNLKLPEKWIYRDGPVT